MPLTQKLKYCNFKNKNLSPPPPPPTVKRKKRLYILYILNKTTLTTETTSTVLHNLFLLDMSIFSDLLIKNDPAKGTVMEI